MKHFKSTWVRRVMSIFVNNWIKSMLRVTQNSWQTAILGIYEFILLYTIFPDFRIVLQILLLSQMFLKEEKYPPRKERSSLYCVQTSSFLFVGMWKVGKSCIIKHPRVCPLDQRETQACYQFFRIFVLLSNTFFTTLTIILWLFHRFRRCHQQG